MATVAWGPTSHLLAELMRCCLVSGRGLLAAPPPRLSMSKQTESKTLCFVFATHSLLA